MTSDGARDSPEHQAPGVVELREDIPLKAGGGGGGGGGCARGPRLIVAAFAALTAAVTLALLTQIYYGDYQVVPHGAASSSAAACSRAGSDALKAGGRAVDAAAAAALCLAVVAPHRTSLDASGAMLYWEYRQSRTQQPLAVEWGGPSPELTEPGQRGPGLTEPGPPGDRPPRLVAALAALHAQYGVLPWARLLQPAISLARDGFLVSEGLAAVRATEPVGSLKTAPELARYLETLQQNTSAELSSSWGAESWLRRGRARAAAAGGRRAWAAGARATPALEAIVAALTAPPDDAFLRVVQSLQRSALAGGAAPATGVGSGLAVVDRTDTYAALVTGLSMPFGNGPATGDGWTRDEPTASLDLAPAIITEDHICGTRYVIGAESSGALAQAAAALALAGAAAVERPRLALAGAAAVERPRLALAGAAAVERPRLALLPAAALAREAARPLPDMSGLPAVPTLNASLPYAAVNVVQQRADALLSHADSRGGGLASRF